MEQSLKNERKRLKRRLKGIYRKEYNKITKALRQDLSDDSEFQQIDLGVLVLLMKAQDEQKEPQSALGDDPEGFYLALLQQARSYSIKNRFRASAIELLMSGWMVLFLAVALLVVRLYHTDFYQLQKKGFAFLQRNGGVIQSVRIFDTKVSFELDLSDLAANASKTVFEEDGCQIILIAAEEENGNILLRFRSEGVLENGGGRLISAVKHLFDENGASYFVMNAVMSFEINGKSYISSAADMSALNKTGDEFSFELFSASDFVGGEFIAAAALEESAKVIVTLDGLVETLWK